MVSEDGKQIDDDVLSGVLLEERKISAIQRFFVSFLLECQLKDVGKLAQRKIRRKVSVTSAAWYEDSLAI
jgi:hypothetical protein